MMEKRDESQEHIPLFAMLFQPNAYEELYW